MIIILVKRYRSTMSKNLTISILSTIDPALRGAATVNLALDHPDVVTVTHDILDGHLRRVVADATGTIESQVVELEHVCLSCAVREDVIPTLAHLASAGRWSQAVVALPVSAEPAPLLRSLEQELGLRGLLRGSRYGATVAVVDANTLESDAFDDSPIADRGAVLHPDDDRVTAEALAPLLAMADVIVLASDHGATPRAVAAATHLRGDGAEVVTASVTELPPTLLRPRGSAHATLDRANPLRPATKEVPDSDGVWTLHLSSERPFHPGRLRANLHRLADHPVRARGVFWVAARPGVACAWEGAGRQLFVGECGRWGRRSPRTHLIITGNGTERAAIADAFHQCLARPDELASLGAPGADALDDWFDQPLDN